MLESGNAAVFTAGVSSRCHARHGDLRAFVILNIHHFLFIAWNVFWIIKSQIFHNKTSVLKLLNSADRGLGHLQAGPERDRSPTQGHRPAGEQHQGAARHVCGHRHVGREPGTLTGPSPSGGSAWAWYLLLGLDSNQSPCFPSKERRPLDLTNPFLSIFCKTSHFTRVSHSLFIYNAYILYQE